MLKKISAVIILLLLTSPAWSGYERNPGYEEFVGYADDSANRYNVPRDLIVSIIAAESSFNPGAISDQNCKGLMQLCDQTAARFGVENVWNPAENIEGGARYLQTLLGLFQGNIRLAVAAYFDGEDRVQAWGNEVPHTPKTQAYVKKIMYFYNHLKSTGSLPSGGGGSSTTATLAQQYRSKLCALGPFDAMPERGRVLGFRLMRSDGGSGEWYEDNSPEAEQTVDNLGLMKARVGCK